MPVDPILAASEKVGSELRSFYPLLMEGSDAVRDHVTEQIRQWELATHSILDKEFSFQSHEQKLSTWEQCLQSMPPLEGGISEAVGDYTSFCKAVGHPANEDFWRSQIKTSG